jgi:hypothetical protein
VVTARARGLMEMVACLCGEELIFPLTPSPKSPSALSAGFLGAACLW